MTGSKGTIRLHVIPSEKPGDRIGRYKLLQQIGEGGCGVVYMAEQEEPVHRRVALKVIKLGMDTKNVIARFEAERQALALMDHSNIAKVLEAGATDTGRPYFVMELVRGIKITDYCNENSLSTVARLELFIQVCQAIQHAHQKGIIHRDIKPSNILVADHDGKPVPKIIDFGIAKATTDQRLTDKTLFTAFEQFIGTPAYMSPEQARLSGLDIDTRSDIYSLGVLLYELLMGKTPFESDRLLKAGLDEIRRIIREDEPLRPSTRLQALDAAEQTTVARHRQTDPPKLAYLIRGDLDWIVMKCLEKDRARRYDTANGLAADIQRHLSNEPVYARPPSGLYKFQKLIRRNQLTFIAVSAVTTALIVGLVVSTWMFFKEQQARQQAEAERTIAKTEAAKATAISDFLQLSLQSANPDDLKGSDYTVRQQLDDFSSGLGNQFKDQPEVEAAVRTTLGMAYYRLGIPDKAQRHLERALMLRRGLYGENELVAATLADCAWASFEQGQFPNAESQAREALEIYRKDGTIGQPVLFAMWALQETLNSERRYADVETVTKQALDIAHQTPGKEFPETASIIHGLVQAKNAQSKYAEAEILARQAVEMHRRLQGSQHPETGWALVALGQALAGQNKLEEAERAYREALSIFSKQYPSGHKSVDAATSGLRNVLEAKGDLAGLVALDQTILSDQRSVFGNDNLTVALTLFHLVNLLYAQNKSEEAMLRYHEAVNVLSNAPTQANDADRLNEAAWEFVTADEPSSEDAAAALELAQKAAQASRSQNDLIMDTLAAAYAMAGQFTNAVRAEQDAIALAKSDSQKSDDASRLRLYESNHPYRDRDRLVVRAMALLNEGKFAEAEPVARECLSTHEIQIPDDWHTFNARSMLGGSLLGQKKYAEAEPLLLSGYEGMKQREDKIPPAGMMRPQEALQRLMQLYENTQRSDQAARWKNELGVWTNQTNLPR